MATEESIIRIPPYHYIHVLDQNSNVSRVEVGPKTYIRQDNERFVCSPGDKGGLFTSSLLSSGNGPHLGGREVSPAASFGGRSWSSQSFSPSNRVLFAPMRMVTVPPRHYCTVVNPVCRDAQGAVLFDITGQVRLRHADQEIRLAQDPFPLYPGEVLEKVPA
jgi:major vault protein